MRLSFRLFSRKCEVRFSPAFINTDVPEKNSVCFENCSDQTTEKASLVPDFSLCKSISETTSDAMIGFINFWLQCPSATWHVYLGCHKYATTSLHKINQGTPPLQRGEYLAEKCHPGSLRLRHWAPPLESEGPLVPGTHRRAVTRRLQDHASYCKIRAVRRDSQGCANSHQDTITTKYELTARKLD